MYCQTCGGGRVVAEMDKAANFSHEICEECLGSGIKPRLILQATRAVYIDKREGEELLGFELEGLPLEWLEDLQPKLYLGSDKKLYLRIGRKLNPNGQPKENGIYQTRRTAAYKTAQEDG